MEKGNNDKSQSKNLFANGVSSHRASSSPFSSINNSSGNSNSSSPFAPKSNASSGSPFAPKSSISQSSSSDKNNKNLSQNNNNSSSSNLNFSQNINIPNNSKTEPLKRLNAFDSTILEDTSFVELDDEDLKLSKRIKRLEEFLDLMNERISIAYSYLNKEQINQLIQERDKLIIKIDFLKSEYKRKNLCFRLKLNMLKVLEAINFLFDDYKKYINDFFIKIHIKKIIDSIVEPRKYKNNISKLNKINKTVDDLINLTVPYGEEEKRYYILAQHLAKANYLHSKISKQVKT